MKPAVAKCVITFIVATCVVFQGCKKTGSPPVHPPPALPGTKVGLLKEVVAQRLPSPLYRFDYTDSGRTTSINFASGFFIYELQWKEGRLDKMINTFNLNALVYSYTNGQITRIREVRTNNTTAWNYSFSYNVDDQLKEVRWQRISNSGTDSFVYRKVLLSYNNDRNLVRYDDYRDLTGKLEWVQTVKFSNFDSGKNVDDFNILKEFDDNLLYLPGVKLQVNNPRDILVLGPQNDYAVTYTWQYQNGLPVSKQNKTVQVRGKDAGMEAVNNTSYSYY